VPEAEELHEDMLFDPGWVNSSKMPEYFGT